MLMESHELPHCPANPRTREPPGVVRPPSYNPLMKSVRAESGRQRWEVDVLQPALKKSPERAVPFTTVSGRPIERLYTADDLDTLDYSRDLNHPGVFPYTRGIHP